MTNDLLSVLTFIVGLVISTIIIYVTTKLFGQKEEIGRAFVTALIGTLIYLWHTTFLATDSYPH